MADHPDPDAACPHGEGSQCPECWPADVQATTRAINAMRAVVQRWHSTDWKAAPTADFIRELEDAADALAAQPAAEPAWWRKRADEIELQVALGQSDAMRCYTDMRALLQAAAQPASEPVAWQSRFVGMEWCTIPKDHFDDVRANPSKWWPGKYHVRALCLAPESADKAATPVAAQPARAGGDAPVGIYVASRASVPERPMMWQGLRMKGWPITSTWIDEAGEGETADLGELWSRIHAEIQRSAGVLLYAEVDDFPLKGALVECGIALGMGKPVAVVLPNVRLDARSMKPLGSWSRHPLVTRYETLDAARAALAAAPQPAGGAVPPIWRSDQYGGEFDDMTAAQGYRMGWNDCRAAMLAAPQPASAEQPTERESRVLHGDEPLDDQSFTPLPVSDKKPGGAA